MSEPIIGELVEESTAIVPLAAPKPIAWVPTFALAIDEAVERVEAKHAFFKRVMRNGDHYGVIPGTGTKPALLKPGAELLLSSMGLYVELTDAESPIRDYDGSKEGAGEALIMYRRVCRVFRQIGNTEHERMIVAQAEGSCSSRESKYRYRNAKRICPECGKAAIIKGREEYGGGWVCFKTQDGYNAKSQDGDPAIEKQDAGKVANADIADVENTILKMADKRALVAAALLATGCSDIFTQDVEENADSLPPEPTPQPKPTPAPAPKVEPKAKPEPNAPVEQKVRDWLDKKFGGLSQNAIKSSVFFATGGRGTTLADLRTVREVELATEKLTIQLKEAKA